MWKQADAVQLDSDDDAATIRRRHRRRRGRVVAQVVHTSIFSDLS